MGGGPPPPARLGAGAARRAASPRCSRRSRASSGLPARVLAPTDGERRLTDLRHVGQLLHAAAIDRAARRHRADRLAARAGSPRPSDDTGDEERSRRLESDAEAVQVLTIHRSKGLEFPIVYCPFLWEPGYIPRRAAARSSSTTRTPATRARSTSALEGRGLRAPPASSTSREQRGEDLRLAYVALTRARHQAVVWWAGSWDSRDSPLGRLLFAPRRRTATSPPSGGSTPDDAAALDALRGAGRRDGAGLRSASSAPTLRRAGAWSRRSAARRRAGRGARSTATLDRRWRRTSYSDITAARPRGAGGQRARGAACVADEPRRAGGRRPPRAGGEPDAAALRAVAVAAGGDARRRATSARSCTACSRRPTSPPPTSTPSSAARIADGAGAARRRRRRPAARRRRACARRSRRRSARCSAARALRDIARADRLDELDFELPLAGGDAARPGG